MTKIVKKILCVAGLLLAIPVIPSPVKAESERVAVSLRLPPDFVQKTCPASVWKGTTVFWKGVKDARDEIEIGRQSKKKGKDPIFVDSDPPLEAIVGDVLQGLLSACGLKLVTDLETEVRMSAEVREFYAGVEKGIFTGKGTAKSRLIFNITRRNDPTERTVEVGYEMEAKKIRQRDVRQLEATLNELLARTLEQVPKLDGFKGL